MKKPCYCYALRHRTIETAPLVKQLYPWQPPHSLPTFLGTTQSNRSDPTFCLYQVPRYCRSTLNKKKTTFTFAVVLICLCVESHSINAVALAAPSLHADHPGSSLHPDCRQRQYASGCRSLQPGSTHILSKGDTGTCHICTCFYSLVAYHVSDHGSPNLNRGTAVGFA